MLDLALSVIMLIKDSRIFDINIFIRLGTAFDYFYDLGACLYYLYHFKNQF